MSVKAPIRAVLALVSMRPTRTRRAPARRRNSSSPRDGRSAAFYSNRPRRGRASRRSPRYDRRSHASVSRSWVTMTTVRPKVFLRSAISSSNCGGGDRIEPGGRLVEEQNLRIERQRTGERGPLDHAAGQLGRILRAVRLLEPDQLDLDARKRAHQPARKVQELAHRDLDVLPDRQRGEQRAELEEHAPALLHLQRRPVRSDRLAEGLDLSGLRAARARGWSGPAPIFRFPKRRRWRGFPRGCTSRSRFSSTRRAVETDGQAAHLNDRARLPLVAIRSRSRRRRRRKCRRPRSP